MLTVAEIQERSSVLASLLGLASDRGVGEEPAIPFPSLVQLKPDSIPWNNMSAVLGSLENGMVPKDDGELVLNHLAAHYLPDLLAAFKLCTVKIGSPWTRALVLVLPSPYLLKHFRKDTSELEELLIFVAERLVSIDERELKTFRRVGVDMDEGKPGSFCPIAHEFCDAVGEIKGILDRNEKDLLYLITIFNHLGLLFVRFSTPGFLAHPTRKIIPEPTLTLLKTSTRAWKHWCAHHHGDYITGMGYFDNGEAKPHSTAIAEQWGEHMGSFHSTSVFLESIRTGGRLVPPPAWFDNGVHFKSPDERELRDTCQIALRDGGRNCAKSSSLQTCAKCKSVAYCWREHQAADWKRHKLSCYKDLDS